MKIQISNSRGNENTRGVVRGLYEKQMLQSYIVSVAVFANDFFYSLFPPYYILFLLIFFLINRNLVQIF